MRFRAANDYYSAWLWQWSSGCRAGWNSDHFVAVDERSWLTRSGNFYLALTTGDWAATFQRYHPGVTTMWLGMLGFLWQYPEYPADAEGQISSMSTGIENFLAAHGHPPLTLLAAGRSFVVIAIVLLLLTAFWLATDLLGWLPALTGIVLLGFEPLGLGLTRMLHVDGLSSSLMLVSVLAYMRFRAPNAVMAGRWHDLILSAIMAGLGWLTKSPALFLGPMVVLIAGIDLLRTSRSQHRLSIAALGQAVRDLTIWGMVAVLVFFICWPSMWVQPVANIQAIFGSARESAEEGHDQKIYFNGEALSGDPGASFYPITYLWRTTPITLIGLGLALVVGVIGMRRRNYTWQNTALLLLYALAFALFITLGSKKFDRYLLPTYFALAMMAGVGWYALTDALRGIAGVGLAGRWLLPLALAGQAAFALPNFPYYFTYYNPLLGGIARAPEVLMIGLGEGIDQAARYLNAKPDAEQLRVAAWYQGGSFNYIFKGVDLDFERFYEADYAELYLHQWQRQVPNVQTMDYFATLTPETIIKLHGLDYVWIYDLRNALPPSSFTDWAEAIRLVETKLPRASLVPSDTFVVQLRLYSIGTTDTNLSAVVRLIDAGGNEIGRSEGWPFGSPTSTWQPGELYADGHEFLLPANIAPGYLRVELSFYDSDAQTVVTPMVAGTNTPRADFVGIGYVAVGLENTASQLCWRMPPLWATRFNCWGRGCREWI